MNTQVTFDLVVIGAGPGGYVAAIRAAQLGMNVACIEKEPALGGTCLRVGCIPSKALLDSSEHYLYAKTKLNKHGVEIGTVRLNLDTLIKRKDTVVRQLTQGIAGLFKKNNITRLTGTGRIQKVGSDIHEISVQSAEGTSVIRAKKILIATGSVPIDLPGFSIDEQKIVTSTGALSLSRVPNHLVVIGGGVIGLELGSVWMRLGAKVTVLEFMSQFLSNTDQQTGKELHKALLKQGMNFHFGTQALGCERKGDWFTVEAEDRAKKEKFKLECDTILVATGRRPNTEGLGAREAGISMDDRGRILINDHFETSAPGIYAVGDVVRGPMLAHKAEEEGIAAVEILAGQAGHVNYDAIPSVIYTWPELASVGESEESLKQKGISYKTGVFPFLANGRAKALDEMEGFAKVLSDSTTDRILGVHIVGPRASDMIAEAVMAMEFGGSAEDIARTCHAHPTLSETLKEAALAVDKRQIHF